MARFNRSLKDGNDPGLKEHEIKRTKKVTKTQDIKPTHNGTVYCKVKAKAWKTMRLDLGEQQNWKCCYCGDAMHTGIWFENHPEELTIEHIIPRSKGGSDNWENLAAACRECNTARGVLDLDPMAFFHRATNFKLGRRKQLEKIRDNHVPPFKKKEEMERKQNLENGIKRKSQLRFLGLGSKRSQTSNHESLTSHQATSCKPAMPPERNET